jgi:O-antigen ligase
VREYYQENVQLYAILVFWLIIGMYGGPLIYAVLPLLLILMKRKGMYEEMFIGFFLVLILSDSYEHHLLFAKSAKNIYISALAVFFLFDRKVFYPFNPIYKLFIPFFLVSLYCLFYSETIVVSVQKTLSYFLLFLIVPNYFTKLYREKGSLLLRNIVFFAVTILIVSFLMIFINRTLVYPIGSRYQGVLGNPNGLGLFCFFTFLLFSLVQKIHKKLFSSHEIIIIYILIGFSLLLTGSRNSIIGVLIFMFFQKFYKISPFLGILMVIIIGFLTEIIGNHFSVIISSLGLGDFFRVKTLDNGSGRYVAWLFAWNHIQDSFFIGKGFGYDEHYMRSNWDLLSKMGHQGGIHNTFLTFWMDFGLIGLLIYLRSYFLAFIFAAKKTVYAFPILFAVTFTAVFESWLVGSLNPHTILFLLILTLISDDTFYAEEVQIPETETLLLNENGVET